MTLERCSGKQQVCNVCAFQMLVHVRALSNCIGLLLAKVLILSYFTFPASNQSRPAMLQGMMEAAAATNCRREPHSGQGCSCGVCSRTERRDGGGTGRGLAQRARRELKLGSNDAGWSAGDREQPRSGTRQMLRGSGRCLDATGQGKRPLSRVHFNF